METVSMDKFLIFLKKWIKLSEINEIIIECIGNNYIYMFVQIRINHQKKKINLKD